MFATRSLFTKLPSRLTPQNGAAIITGSAQGIGRAIALRLSQDGYPIVLNDLPEKKTKLEAVVKEITSVGGDATFVVGDVSVEQDVKAVVESAVASFGKLDAMVSNAGIALVGMMANTTVEEWDSMFAINVRGTFLCYREAAAQMIKQGTGGRIVGAGSVAGKQASLGFGAYTASKFAVRGLTQSAACDYGSHGITVNAYAPGVVQTSLTEVADDVAIEQMGMGPGEWAKMIQRGAPLKFLGQPVDIAGLVSYLVSPDSRWVTGQTISINGGAFFD